MRLFCLCFLCTWKNVQGWDSHVENSSEWYINRHDHDYLRRTMGEHVGNVNTNRA